jgi:Fic family protein
MDLGLSDAVDTLHAVNDDTAYWLRLSHPLSPHALARLGGVQSEEQIAQALAKIAARNRIEMTVLNNLQADIFTAIDNSKADNLAICLENLASSLLNIKTRIRTTAVLISPDTKGIGWQCLPAGEVRERLTDLQHYITIHAAQSPLQTAIVALVMVSCIHPFMDGNGRLSRVIFHAILRKHGAAKTFYVPLKYFYARSEYGFQIRLRHVFITSDWTQIMQYFCAVLEPYCTEVSKLNRVSFK